MRARASTSIQASRQPLQLSSDNTPNKVQESSDGERCTSKAFPASRLRRRNNRFQGEEAIALHPQHPKDRLSIVKPYSTPEQRREKSRKDRAGRSTHPKARPWRRSTSPANGPRQICENLGTGQLPISHARSRRKDIRSTHFDGVGWRLSG